MADCCCFCTCRKNKLAPTESRDNSRKFYESENECTEVEIEDKDDIDEEDGTWTVTGVFKSIFHASPDNKLAVKLYGSKKMVKKDQEMQLKGCSKWMIHPYSHFR